MHINILYIYDSSLRKSNETIIIGITSEWVLKNEKLLINKYNNII